MLFTHLDAAHWRDYASMNQYVLRTTFPAASMEFSADWADRAAMGTPFVFDRVLFADRAAAINGDNFGKTQRTASEAFVLPASAHWWSTVRNSVIEASGLNASVGAGTRGKPVITYISRQNWPRRKLIQSDDDVLVEELYKLRDQYGYEVNVVSMDQMSRVEQLQLAGRTTVGGLFDASCRFVSHASRVDHDGRARERSHVPAVDEAVAEVHRHGVLLPRRFRARLRVHDARARDGPLRILGQQVRRALLVGATVELTPFDPQHLYQPRHAARGVPRGVPGQRDPHRRARGCAALP